MKAIVINESLSDIPENATAEQIEAILLQSDIINMREGQIYILEIQENMEHVSL